MSERRLLVLDLAVKFTLVALLLFGAFSGLDRFEGKAMTGRALVYPIAVVVVPAVWWLWFRRTRYPYALDILIVLPFLIDTAGNALDLYDSVSWWDRLHPRQPGRVRDGLHGHGRRPRALADRIVPRRALHGCPRAPAQ